MKETIPPFNVRSVINASGTMTALGASAAGPEAIRAACEVLPIFLEIDDLQREASRAIARATGAEAGYVTACSSAGLTLAIAAAMTGGDPVCIAQLPDAIGMKNHVAIQSGHLIDYGAPIEQAVRLAGARVVVVGEKGRAVPDQLEAAIDDQTAAALYVVSHHTEQIGQISLDAFSEVCKRRGVPLIVDAASEYDLTGFIAAGADIAIYSAHKFLGGLTAGIVAGRKDLVRNAYLQNWGIGRGMKVGKEGIASTIAALQAWSERDHAAYRQAEDARVSRWTTRLSGVRGLRLELSPDPTGNPITRLRLHVDAEAGVTAWALADILAEGERPVMVRTDEIAHGYVELDPCNLSDSEAEEVADRILAALRLAESVTRAASTYSEWLRKSFDARRVWPD
jgi:L-seryl-tRNA(Ser) seleniumtransferase